jgi:integrase
VIRQVREDGTVIGPKGKRGKRKTRKVDMAEELAAILEPYIATRRRFTMKVGKPGSEWLCYPDFSNPPTGGQVSTVTHRLRRAMGRVLTEAMLPHFTPHALRHTFATLLLQRGEDPLFVARQLGDTMAVTIELYGRHARVKSRFGGPNLLSQEV